MKKRKMLPKKNAQIGLYLYCNTHKKWYKDDTVVQCKCELTYKAKLHVPGTKRACKCKSFEADTLENAIQLFNQFKIEMKNNSYQNVSLETFDKKPIFLTDCQQRFIDFKNDIGVEFHNMKNLPRRNIRHAEMVLEYMNEALSTNGIKTATFRFEEINDKIVGFVTAYFLGPKDMANKTFNNNIAPIKTFMNFIIKKYYPTMANPFDEVEKLKVVSEKLVVKKDEFLSVINLVSPENLVIEKINKNTQKLKRRHYYRPWLIDGFYLAMLGGRNEEVSNLKWSDIKLNNEGQKSFIQVVDLKRTRNIKHKSKLEKDGLVKKNIEMTPYLNKLLNDLGYEEKKNTNEYILANDEPTSRKEISNILSTAFNFLIKKLNLTEKKEFRNLRKTYATDCYLKDPEKFYKEMGHTNKYTTLNHYVDMDFVMEERRRRLYEEKE